MGGNGNGDDDDNNVCVVRGPAPHRRQDTVQSTTSAARIGWW